MARRLRVAGTGPDREPISVLIAHRHLAVTRGLRLLLRSVDTIEVIGEAADMSTALTLLPQLLPDVLLLDLGLVYASGLQVIQKAQQAAPGAAIIVVSTNTDRTLPRLLGTTEIDACVATDRADRELAPAIRAAVASRRRQARVGNATH